MKCKICGAESGKYPLCRTCNTRKENGEVIKCQKCGNWHLTASPCPTAAIDTNDAPYLYDVKNTLISKQEQAFFNAIQTVLPEGYHVFPQINLATFINRTDDARFHNELFRNVDFLITDTEYKPRIVIEVNDRSHLTNERRERDEKVKRICEEAGIPILKLWTTYGVNPDYIKEKIQETLSNPVTTRVHHFSRYNEPETTAETSAPQQPQPQSQSKAVPPMQRTGACYVATCVYGSYNCPEVWVLRRYRDTTLARTTVGRAFIKAYYAISPTFVKYFGKTSWFKRICKGRLDILVAHLQKRGFKNTPYDD